jgi:AraC-like DNA-binding protein
MDIHHVPGAEALDLAQAHQKDLLLQDRYHCKSRTYWLDETRGVAFCLIEAPNEHAVEEMHQNAHGFMPYKIIEVKNEVVESFLGRIHDPEETEINESGLKVFSESAYRILLVTDHIDPILLRHRLGTAKTDEMMAAQNKLIRSEVAAGGGRMVQLAGRGSISSFSSVSQAVSSGLEIQKNLPAADKKITHFKMGVSSGEPVAKSDKLFGEAIQLARNLCAVSKTGRIILSSEVKNLLDPSTYHQHQKDLISLSTQDEALLESLVAKLEANWQDPDFAVSEFCQSMLMSKSQLYRKTIAFWDLSPNLLLKEYRLDKACDLLKKHQMNISQTTFDSGFTSPSYFSKCFKKKFGILPANYLSFLQS